MQHPAASALPAAPWHSIRCCCVPLAPRARARPLPPPISDFLAPRRAAAPSLTLPLAWHEQPPLAHLAAAAAQQHVRLTAR
jgi:hypothetical protein